MRGVNMRTIEILCWWKDLRMAPRYQPLSMAALHEAVARLEARSASPLARGTNHSGASEQLPRI